VTPKKGPDPLRERLSEAAEKLAVRFLEFSSDKYRYLKNLPEGSLVLDIGTGDCRRLRYRSHFRSDLIQYGVDLKENEACRKHVREFFVCDVARDALPFRDGFFDLIVLSHVIEHIPRVSIQSVLSEIRRTLKKGGHLFIELPSERTTKLVSGSTLRKFGLPVGTLNFADDPTHISPLTLGELRGILETNGFSVTKCGDVREPVKKAFSPLLLFAGVLLRSENLATGALWSLVNWASFAVAVKG